MSHGRLERAGLRRGGVNPSLFFGIFELRSCDSRNSSSGEPHNARCACLDAEKHQPPCPPCRPHGRCKFTESKELSLGSAPEVMSPWKHEHSSPHLSRSLSCLCSRKKHFLALVSSQGSPAGCPVSGGAGHPVASLEPPEPLGGRAWQSPRCRLQTSQCLRSWGVRLHVPCGEEVEPGFQRRPPCGPVTTLTPLQPIL